MIVIRVKGGLGNQLFQYASAKGLATSLGKTLKIDGSKGFLGYPVDRYDRSYRIGCFGIPSLLASPWEIWCARAISCRRWLRLRRLESEAMVNEAEYFQSTLAAQLGGPVVYLEAYLQSPLYFSSVEAKLRNELRSRLAMDSKMKDYLRQIQSSPSVSLHVRRRDFPRPLPTDYYKKAVELVNVRIANPHFFVFGDDPDWISTELAWLEPKTVVRNIGPDDDVKDLSLMNSCRSHIIANSTYSWWGAWLSGAKPMVVAPIRGWTSNGLPPKGLLPSDWIRI